ncbi:LysE family translocator [Actibacterium sp. 188UL27-1]|uniref:LysE family translocator n=1 Tax=Actibacterium sp. 188UL27-1 TaxID=2786961 RepID=UPI001955F833|nr:LysE family transporter [Actibacterium sp. 188UL27-1]MBM7066866.1 LysE family transporter [Actibacterium sp. 188UL27-1]
MVVFALAVFFLIITPGPGVLSTAGVGAAFGGRDGARYVLGLFLGNNLVIVAVVTGMAALVLADPRIRLVLYGASVTYLLYLAARIAFAGTKLAFIGRDTSPGVIGGVALQPINPKAYVVNATLFSGFAFLPEAPGIEMFVKLLIVNAIWVPIHLLWLWAGISLRRLNLTSGAQRAINIAMAVSMLLVVGLAAISAPV